MWRKGIRLLIITICLSLVITMQAFASEKEKTVVRVGIFDYKAFYGEDAYGEPYGYGYEYFDNLAQYGGFSYEYVYGSWAQCLSWLESGRIDMIDSAQKSPSREEKFIFSEYSTGTSYGELFVKADNDKISYNNFAAMDGLTVGMLEGNSRNETFLEYAQQNGFSVKTVFFKNEADLSNALQDDKVDAVVSSNLRQEKNERSVSRFSPAPFYLMFNRNQTQIKDKMDKALEEILLTTPNFNAQLLDKYYPRDKTSIVLTLEERQFIKDKQVLKVVYNDNWSPFSSYNPENGGANGINIDIITLLGKKTGLAFEFIQSSSQEEAAEMIKTGQADLLLGFKATQMNKKELELLATDAFLSVPLCLVGLSSAVEDGDVFTVPKNSKGGLWLLKEQFPNSAITVLETTEDCYRAVRNGEADFTLDNVYTALEIIDNSKDRSLIIAFVFPVNDYYSFGLGQTDNQTLVNLLNKGIADISQAELTAIFSHNNAMRISDMPLTAILYKYRTILILIGVVLISLLIGAFLLLYFNSKNRKKILWRNTYIDALTGIGNQKLLEQDMRKKLDENPKTKYVMCKFDIEDLKIINEINGFEAGDRIIKALADEIRSVANPTQDAYARISGDDFVMLKSYMERKNTPTVLLESELRVSDIIHRELNCLIKLKFGIYYIDDNSESVSSILEKVNYAHSNCKNNAAINRCYYDETEKQSLIEEKKIETRMIEALEQNEFKLYLQPKYYLADETLAGAEALVRWSNDDNGEMVYPNSFIPLFEKNGFVTKLDMYMLNLVCQLIQSWINEGKEPTTISINFSRIHLLNSNFTNEICEVVNRYKVPRKFIEIELTESTMFNNEETMFGVLQRLHEQGFTLSMDDFGTGYSSLGLLKNLPVDVIKIDRSFFENSQYKTRARAVIENVMQMAKRLNIHTVAEGVERQEQIDMLRDMGCEIVQGYYFSKPMPVSEFCLDRMAKPNHTSTLSVDIKMTMEELGQISIGREKMGEMTSVLAYRMFAVSMRKTLTDIYGEGEAMLVLRAMGKLAGAMFAREMMNSSLPLDEYLLVLASKLREFNIAELSVENLDLKNCSAVVVLSSDIDCSGFAPCNKTFCQYDEGFLAGIMKEYTKQSFSVEEVDCWGTGSDFCRFEIKVE